MITAKQAIELAGPGATEYLAEIESKIRSAAKTGKRELIIREQPFAYWLYPRLEQGSIGSEVVNELNKNGFKVSLHYAEMQFVDIGLKITW